KPTADTLAPSTLTRNTGKSAWIISEEMSIRRLTKPSAHTPRGIVPKEARGRSPAFVVTFAPRRGVSLQSARRQKQDAGDGGQARFLSQPDVARPNRALDARGGRRAL